MKKGIFAIFTGNGKGKSTAALGHVARALGHGKKVCVIQFIKGNWQTGEQNFFQDIPRVDFHVCGRGFTWKSDDLSKDIALAKEAWQRAEEAIASDYDLIVLDELTYLIHYKMVDEETILGPIKARRSSQHIIMTGRHASQKCRDAADLVTEMGDEKHPYRAGIKAQAGFDY